MTTDRLIGVEELSQLIGRSPATIRADLCRSPERLPPRVLLDGRKRQRPQWKQSTVMRWLASQSEGARPADGTKAPVKVGRPRNAISI